MIIKLNLFLTYNHSSSNDFLFLTTTNTSSIEFVESMYNLNLSLYYYHYPFFNQLPTFTKLVSSFPFKNFYCISFNTPNDNLCIHNFQNNYSNFLNSIKSLTGFKKSPF